MAGSTASRRVAAKASSSGSTAAGISGSSAQGLRRGFLNDSGKSLSSFQRRPVSSSSSPVPGYKSSGPSSFPKRDPLPQPHRQKTFGPSAPWLGQQIRHSSSSSGNDQSSTSPVAPKSLARRFTAFYASNFERRPVATLCVANSILGFIGDACAQLIPIVMAASGQAPVWDFARSFRFWAYGFSLGPLIEKWNRFLEFRFPLRPMQQVFQEAPNPAVDISQMDPSSPEFVQRLQKEAEREGFKVNIERGSQDQGQSLGSATSAGTKIVDPQTITVPNMAGPVSFAALFKRVALDQGIFAPLGLALFIAAMGILEGMDWPEVQQKLAKLWWPLTLINWQIWPLVQIVNFRYMPLRYRVPFSSSLGILWTVFISFRNAQSREEEVQVQVL